MVNSSVYMKNCKYANLKELVLISVDGHLQEVTLLPNTHAHTNILPPILLHVINL